LLAQSPNPNNNQARPDFEKSHQETDKFRKTYLFPRHNLKEGKFKVSEFKIPNCPHQIKTSKKRTGYFPQGES
jgi:hypothetical protein